MSQIGKYHAMKTHLYLACRQLMHVISTLEYQGHLKSQYETFYCF